MQLLESCRKSLEERLYPLQVAHPSINSQQSRTLVEGWEDEPQYPESLTRRASNKGKGTFSPKVSGSSGNKNTKGMAKVR